MDARVLSLFDSFETELTCTLLLCRYKRYEKRHRNIPAHISPCFAAKEGDVITMGQCRPLSKTVRFNVLKVEPCGESSVSIKKQFRMF